MSSKAFLKHTEFLKKEYTKCLCVNLLCQRKSGEHSLTTMYESLVKKHNLDYLRYEFFDFHKRCPGK